MKKDKLIKVKENFNQIMNEEISRIENAEMISSIKDMPFYKLKNIFESITGRLYETEKGKRNIGKYIRIIKESKMLNGINRIVNTINKANVPAGVDSNTLLNECVSVFRSGFNSTVYNKDKIKLATVVSESAKMLSLSADDVKNYSLVNESVNESLDCILTKKPSVDNICGFLTEHSNVLHFLNENRKNDSKEDTVSETNKTLENLCSEGLDDWAKKVVEDISIATLSGKEEKELFEEYKSNCIDSLNEAIEDEEEIENKSRFSNMKLQLEGKEYNSETFIDDLLKLSELNESLL